MCMQTSFLYYPFNVQVLQAFWVRGRGKMEPALLKMERVGNTTLTLLTPLPWKPLVVVHFLLLLTRTRRIWPDPTTESPRMQRSWEPPSLPVPLHNKPGVEGRARGQRDVILSIAR